MESLSSESKGIALDILEDILTAIEKVEERTKGINTIDDFLCLKQRSESHTRGCSQRRGGRRYGCYYHLQQHIPKSLVLHNQISYLLLLTSKRVAPRGGELF